MAALRCLVLHQYPCAADSIFLSRISIVSRGIPKKGAFPPLVSAAEGAESICIIFRAAHSRVASLALRGNSPSVRRENCF